jgi:uncharacterized protein
MQQSPEAVIAEAVTILRQAGARFAYLYGSRATGQARADSDIDIAAYFGERPPNSFDVPLPAGVRWEAMTRKIYFDELPRITRAHREFAAAVAAKARAR